MLISCFFSILSRSSVNVLDRYLFGKRAVNFFFLYFCSISLPFIYGSAALGLFGNIDLAVDYLLSRSCFLMAIATNLVGLSFSYAFRHQDIKHIVLYTKIPELMLPVFLMIPLFGGGSDTIFSWKSFIPLIVTWVSFLPYLLSAKHKVTLLNKCALFICTTLLFQMAVSSAVATSVDTQQEVLAFTVALLLWRCILALPFCLLKGKHGIGKWSALSSGMLALILFRGLLSLATQFTFNWAIAEGNPLVVWPILNTTVIVSSVASQIILKEKIHKRDWVALSGVFAGSCLAHAV